MLECIDAHIGYVPATCDCLDAVPSGFGSVTTSSLSKYLSDLMPTDFTKNCGDTSIWNTLKRTRDAAKVDLVNDLIQHYMVTGSIKSPWTGYVGRDSGDSLVSTKTWCGIRLALSRQCRGIYGGIKDLMLKTSLAGNYTVKIIDRYGNELVSKDHTFSSQEVNKWVTKSFEAVVKLPMWSDDSETQHYYIVWNATNVFKNESECGGCGSPKPYMSYFDVDGTNFDSLSQPTNGSTGSYLFGIRPKVNIECDFGALICANDGIVLTSAAICFQLRWAINTIKGIINGGDINKYTAMGGEYLEGLLNQHAADYEKNIAYLSQILYTADCVVCNPSVKKHSIRL